MDVQDLSLSLYNYLCSVVGSEDVVRTRRKNFNALDSVMTKYVTYISSGSRAEGLDFSESDYDVMRVYNHIPVYENIHENMDEILYHKQNKKILIIPLIMDTNDTKPGYTKLKLYDSYHENIPMISDICYYQTYVSSKLVRETNLRDGYFIHGPCISTGHCDQVCSFHSNRWISQAKEWIRRSRSSWPDKRLIATVVQFGVLFVPVGCKTSGQEELEFRISFNVREKVLVHSFNHVQLLCYALLKNILNHFIKPQYGDLLCSYFIKTIMFWVSEESVKSTWQPQNLIRCFDRCFKRLVYCVTYSSCLHYFIPELDLFEDRFSESEHEALKTHLIGLYNTGWQCVLRTSLLNSFNFALYPSPTISSVSAYPSVCYTLSVINSIGDNFEIFIRSVFGSLHSPEKQMYAFILAYVSQLLAHSMFTNETYCDTNKQRYRDYHVCLNHLLLGLHYDAVSGWLLLASFVYTRKQYQQCLHILKYCLHKCTPDKIILTFEKDTKIQHEFNTEMKRHVKNRFLRACKRRLTSCVVFQKRSFIIPAEISSLAVKHNTAFPPVVFAHFLQCICFHHLNRYQEKINAIRDLEATVREKYLMLANDIQVRNSYKCIEIARKLQA